MTYDDTLVSGVYNMGVLDGPFELKAKRVYYDDSYNEINYWNLERKGEYIGGVQNGFWTFYTSWGAKSWEGNMLNGKKSGVWNFFSPSWYALHLD